MQVQPITDLKHVKSIKRLLSDRPRDHLLFVLGVNSGLRVQDILVLKIKDVIGLKVGERVSLKEKKTGKDNVFIVNSDIHKAISEYFASIDLDENNFIFKSRKGKNSPITTYAVTQMVKRWANEVSCKGNYGAHTLRKTWCYQQRMQYGVSWEVLSKRLQHSSPSITRRYIGVGPEEVEAVLLNSI